MESELEISTTLPRPLLTHPHHLQAQDLCLCQSLLGPCCGVEQAGVQGGVGVEEGNRGGWAGGWMGGYASLICTLMGVFRETGLICLSEL